MIGCRCYRRVDDAAHTSSRRQVVLGDDVANDGSETIACSCTPLDGLHALGLCATTVVQARRFSRFALRCSISSMIAPISAMTLSCGIVG